LLIPIHDDFDLAKIEKSGQCFRAKALPDGRYRFVTGNAVLHLREKGECLEADCSDEAWNCIWAPYFDWKRSYGHLRQTLPKDAFMTRAAHWGKGIRILRQEPFEMLITFIISQRKSIPAIQKSVEMLCERYGTPILADGEALFAFPTPEQLSRATVEELADCRLGYRVSYVMDAVQAVCSGRTCLDKMAEMDDEALLQALLGIKGVGIKVASCVCLFAYGRTAMAPVDTWILKIIQREYGGENPFLSYGENAGILQQYAFFYAQSHKDEF